MNRTRSTNELPAVTFDDIANIKQEIDRRLKGYSTTPEPIPGVYRQFVEGLEAEKTALGDDEHLLVAVAHLERMRRLVKSEPIGQDSLDLARAIHHAVPEALQLAAAVSMLDTHREWSSLVNPLAVLHEMEQEEARRTQD